MACEIDRYSSVALRDMLGFEEYIVSMLRQNRFRWYGRVPLLKRMRVTGYQDV